MKPRVGSDIDRKPDYPSSKKKRKKVMIFDKSLRYLLRHSRDFVQSSERELILVWFFVPLWEKICKDYWLYFSSRFDDYSHKMENLTVRVTLFFTIKILITTRRENYVLFLQSNIFLTNERIFIHTYKRNGMKICTN